MTPTLPHQFIGAESQEDQRNRRMTDMVNHPPHYTNGGIECIEAIQAALTEDEFRGYIKGNAMKYLWRERHKGGDQDLQKAAWYLAILTPVGRL